MKKIVSLASVLMFLQLIGFTNEPVPFIFFLTALQKVENGMPYILPGVLTKKTGFYRQPIWFSLVGLWTLGRGKAK